MKFKEAFEHYQAGTATAEEVAYVEEELEKTQLIEEYQAAHWIDPIPPEDIEPDLLIVRKKLRKNKFLNVFLPVIIVAALAAVTMFIVIPAAEANYLDPNETSVDPFGTDLDITMSAYTELLHPGYTYYKTLVTKTGFAQYDLTLMRSNYGSGNYDNFEYVSATLEKGVLKLPYNFSSSNISLNMIARASYPVYNMEDEHKAHVREQLEELPEYVQVTAAISFPEDLTMEELLVFMDETSGNMIWAGIRNAPEDVQRYPLCGIDPYGTGIAYSDINNAYPAFELSWTERTGRDLETHFKSMLSYLLDNEEILTAANKIQFGMEQPEYFEDVLVYVEEAGIMTYGGVFRATPQTLLALLDEGTVTQVWPMEAEIQF